MSDRFCAAGYPHMRDFDRAANALDAAALALWNTMRTENSTILGTGIANLGRAATLLAAAAHLPPPQPPPPPEDAFIDHPQIAMTMKVVIQERRALHASALKYTGLTLIHHLATTLNHTIAHEVTITALTTYSAEQKAAKQAALLYLATYRALLVAALGDPTNPERFVTL